VKVAEERVAVVIPRHSVSVIEQGEGVIDVRAEASNVTPEAEILETATVPDVTTKTITVSAAVVVETPVIVKDVPEAHVPVLKALVLASLAGALPIAILVSTVEVEAVPEVIDSPLHSVPHVPTVVAFVKKV